MRYLVMLFVALGGMLWPVQAAINARLRDGLSSPTLATSANGLIGAITALLVTLAIPAFRPTQFNPSSVPAWGWLGGALGAWIVLSMIVGARSLGGAVMVACFLTGMLVASVTLDHLGAMGYAVRRIEPLRALGVALLIAGTALVTLTPTPQDGSLNKNPLASESSRAGD